MIRKQGTLLVNKEKPKAFLGVTKHRKDFPALHQKVYGKPFVYLDNAATTQKPQPVIDALTHYYSVENANIHRGIYYLSEKATHAYESVRVKVQEFISARFPQEIVFVRGTTEGINLVAQSYGRTFLKAGDEIIISHMEHHSNIVPWQILCEGVGARLRVIPVNDKGELILEEYKKLLNPRTKLVAVTYISNVLGTVNPLPGIIRLAHREKAVVLVDGAQAVPHLRVNLRDLDADFFVFSGHKMFGPTGVGVLYGKRELLEQMPPYQGGGDMISAVTFEKTTYNKLPYKFEAGTPHIGGVIGLGAAVDYLCEIGMERIAAYEKDLLAYATERLLEIRGLRIIGEAQEKSSVISFTLNDIHPHDIGTVLDREGVAIRAGHHCAMPLMLRLGVPATARASLAFYNTREDIDALACAIERVCEVFK